MPDRWVVKLGGSLAASPALTFWLEALAGTGVIIVPGGGPFADQVRAIQTARPFDDSTAHAMALLAMAQYGLMLTGLCPQLSHTDQIEKLTDYNLAGQSVVWLPNLNLAQQSDIPHTWDVTSDSLAAWLAGYLNIQHVLLIKSAEWSGETHRLTDWMDAGIIDVAFGDFADKAGLSVWLCQQGDHTRVSEGLRHPDRVFKRLRSHSPHSANRPHG